MTKLQDNTITPAACPEPAAATYLGLTLGALRKARYAGAIPAVIFNGRKVTYLYADLDAYLAKHRHCGGADRAIGKCTAWRAKRTYKPPITKAA
jgi:hypothetical protein